MRLSVARLLEGFRQLKHRLSAKVAVAIIAARFGSTRLIDNLTLYRP